MTARMDWDDHEARLDALPNRLGALQCAAAEAPAGERGRSRQWLPDSHGCLVALWRGLHGGLTERWRADAGGRSRSCGVTARTEGETDMQSKYPSVCVALVGEDENAFAIVERVQRALREAGVPTAEVKAFTLEACSGDYYHLLETVLRTVETT